MRRAEFDQGVAVQVERNDEDGSVTVRARVVIEAAGAITPEQLAEAENGEDALIEAFSTAVVDHLRRHVLDADGRIGALQQFAPLYARLRLLIPITAPAEVSEGLERFHAALCGYVHEAAE